MGITCGTRHAECSATFPHGAEAKLDVLADAGYSFVRYTGPCAPDGAVAMTEARTCGAVFTRQTAQAKPPTPPVAPTSAAPRVVTAPVREAEPPTPAGAGPGGFGSGEDSIGGGTTAGGPARAGSPAASRSPTTIAKDAVQQTLNAYRDAYNRMDEDGIRRVFPAVPASIREQLRQLKAVEFEFTDEAEYQDLNLPGGTATVVIGVKRVFEARVGGAQKPAESRATIRLHRLGPDSDQWTIDAVRYHK
jgi:hypothetical protein